MWPCHKDSILACHCCKRLTDGCIVSLRASEINAGDVPADAGVQLRLVMRGTGRGNTAKSTIAHAVEHAGWLMIAGRLPRFSHSQDAKPAKSGERFIDNLATQERLSSLYLRVTIPIKFR